MFTPPCWLHSGGVLQDYILSPSVKSKTTFGSHSGHLFSPAQCMMVYNACIVTVGCTLLFTMHCGKWMNEWTIWGIMNLTIHSHSTARWQIHFTVVQDCHFHTTDIAQIQRGIKSGEAALIGRNHRRYSDKLEGVSLSFSFSLLSWTYSISWTPTDSAADSSCLTCWKAANEGQLVPLEKPGPWTAPKLVCQKPKTRSAVAALLRSVTLDLFSEAVGHKTHIRRTLIRGYDTNINYCNFK